jgi:Uma2 family endonuclease
MTIAINQPIQQKPLSFDEFLALYGGNNRYELIDGEVFNLEPTGLHEEVAAFITVSRQSDHCFSNLSTFKTDG